MSDVWGHLIGVVILILIALFIGVWIWAWLPRHRRVFDRMARVPLERDADPGPAGADDGDDGERSDNHGDVRR